MPWRGRRKSICKGCGRHVAECGQLSARQKCEDCGRGAMNDNHDELIAHDGPYFDHWRRRCLASFGVVEVDARRDSD